MYLPVYLPDEAVEMFLIIEHRVLARRILLNIHLRTDFWLLTQQSFLPGKVLLWSRARWIGWDCKARIATGWWQCLQQVAVAQ